MIDSGTEIEELIEQQVSTDFGYSIVLYNDDFNTFEFVIESLVKLCKHEWIQAEQCALLIHNTGKCGVKDGEYKKLKPIHEAFLERGISSKIEKVN